LTKKNYATMRHETYFRFERHGERSGEKEAFRSCVDARDLSLIPERVIASLPVVAARFSVVNRVLKNGGRLLDDKRKKEQSKRQRSWRQLTLDSNS
jgi:hypothetical protein